MWGGSLQLALDPSVGGAAFALPGVEWCLPGVRTTLEGVAYMQSLW